MKLGSLTKFDHTCKMGHIVKNLMMDEIRFIDKIGSHMQNGHIVKNLMMDEIRFIDKI
jgi:hypothetical protein